MKFFQGLKKAAELTVEGPSQPVFSGTDVVVAISGRIDHDIDVESAVAELVMVSETSHEEDSSDDDGPSTTIRTLKEKKAVETGTFLQAGKYKAGHRFEERVTLRLPDDAPPSADTRRAKLSWAVDVRLSAHGGLDVKRALAVFVLGVPSDVESWADAEPSVSGAEKLALAIEDVSSRRLLPGSQATGTVSVRPASEVRVSDLTVDLERVVVVTRKGGCREAKVVTSSPLAGKTTFKAGEELRFPFTVNVPEAVDAPSLHSGRFVVHWYLRALAQTGILSKTVALLEVVVGVPSARAGNPPPPAYVPVSADASTEAR